MAEAEDILENKDLKEEDLSKKVSELEEKLLRVLADSENLKKRVMKEKEDMMKYCISSFAKDVLAIRDNLKLAINNCKKDENSPILEGIKLTMSELDKVLTKYGITPINALNNPFDPNIHQAIFEAQKDDVAPGIVVEVIQDGFMIKDRLLRPALVGVSKKS